MKVLTFSTHFPAGHPKARLIGEIWVSVNGYEGLYEISSKGRVRSLERKCKTYFGERTVKEKYLMPRKSSNGYLTIGLSKNSIDSTFHIHKLVVLHFLNAEIPEGLQINHIDGNKQNNAINNLELVTGSENRKHAFRIGLQEKGTGEKNSQAKLLNIDIQQMKVLMSKGINDKEIAIQFGVSKKYVNDIRNGRSRKNC